MYYSDDGRLVITGEGAIDYVTLTTYSGVQDSLMAVYLEREYGPSDEKIVIGGNYVGIKYTEYVVLVMGYQKKQPHYMLVATGYNSDKIIRDCITEGKIDLTLWNCTRIDIQVTLKKKARRPRLLNLGANLETGKYGEVSNRRKVKVKVIGSDTGDTIYIGSPTSEKQKRIYDKHLTDVSGNNVHMERYEIQYRSRTAQSVLTRITNKGALELSRQIQRVIKGDMSTLPEPFQKKLSAYSWQPNLSTIVINREKPQDKASDTTKWVKSIRYALLRACSQNGDNGLACRKALLEALVCSISDDYLEDWTLWRLLSPYGAIWTVAGDEYTGE